MAQNLDQNQTPKLRTCLKRAYGNALLVSHHAAKTLHEKIPQFSCLQVGNQDCPMSWRSTSRCGFYSHSLSLDPMGGPEIQSSGNNVFMELAGVHWEEFLS